MFLTITDVTGRRQTRIETTPYTIGRGSDNHLQLSDGQVSRHHAEILLENSTWRVRDRKSRFGTYVNGDRVPEAEIAVGDVFRIGETELRLQEDEASSISPASFDFRQVNALLAGLRALGSSQVLDEVLAIVLDSTLELTGAERGFILLAEAEGPLTLRLARADGRTILADERTSQRIPDEVFATGEDRIVTDLLDEAYAPKHAGTVALGIRHVLCTPLKVPQSGAGGERRIGVLYLDSCERGYLQQASTLHALAAEAALVIENARLTQEVLEREMAAQELRIAAGMQQSLLPPLRSTTKLADLAAMTTPCRAVGGDLFDYFELGDGTLAFSVADVAGKGPSAALLGAVVQGLFSAEVENLGEPAAVITRVNRALCRRAVASRFVTGFYGQISGDGHMCYCNAGHNPPFLVTDAGTTRLETGGTVLGLFQDGQYETGVASIAAGDMLVMYSDGVTEAENAAGDEFGEQRLIDCLAGARGRSAEQVLAHIQHVLATFTENAAQNDDVTMMAVKVR